VSRKVTKRHGEQGKLRTLMNRRGAVENPVRKPQKQQKIFKRDRNSTSSMAGLKKCHTQNAFTIEMSIMFYDIAAKGPRKTNQVKGKTRPAKYFHLPDKS